MCGNHQGAQALAYKLVRFGIPKVLITNNGRQFDNSQFRSFCTKLKIDHRLTSISHPQSNGLTILTNQIILQNIRTWIKDAKETGEILFMLTFVLKATIPIEVNLLTFTRLKPTSEERMIEHFDLLEEEGWHAYRQFAFTFRVCMPSEFLFSTARA
ncbi:uncharacterized protein LOC111400389 [Olea europaea var. sylvestris]|uniref:uncharacterized protein LOC111400389 n=1 Tax=Olea europaea var. sylvestris TaxID=158386 RepID=UPI000C1D3F35|nr:uncharacterized protein LOC111400389 [Olea europaea var. sylvestris]